MKRGRWLLALAQLLACSSTATIRRSDGTLIEARILRSDSSHIVAEGRDAEVAIPRADIVDIDHPGNVLAAVGLGVLVLGVQIMAAEDQRGGEALATGLLTSLPGLALTGWGGFNYLRSRGAAATFDEETKRLTEPDPDRPYLPAPTWPTTDPPRPYLPPPTWPTAETAPP